MSSDRRQPKLWALAVGALVLALGLDLWTKHWVWTKLRPGAESVTVIEPLLELRFAFNRGTAFSVVREVEHPLVFLPITALVLAMAVGIAVRSPGVGRLRMTALGLVCGGALGNLHDRLFRVDALGNHGVVDFIQFNYPWGGSWPSFNVADMALVVGTALLMLSLMNADEAAEPGAGGSDERADP